MTYRRTSVSKYARSMVTKLGSGEADMAGHEKLRGSRTEVEDWTNGAREEISPPWQDDKLTVRKVQRMLVTPDRQDQLTTVPTPVGLPRQACCWTRGGAAKRAALLPRLLAREHGQGGIDPLSTSGVHRLVAVNDLGDSTRQST